MPEDPKTPKSRRPANTAFRQQRLKAWQPILTPRTVVPLLFVAGIVFAPVGGLLLWANSKVEELTIDYTTCIQDAQNTTDPTSPMTDANYMPSDLYSSVFKQTTAPGDEPQWRHYSAEVNYFRGVVASSRTPGSVSVQTPICQVQFQVPDDIGPPVFLYYRLSNFYQNHRRYVKSFDQDQLGGTAVSASDIGNGNCAPLQLNSAGKPYYPCGLIANSLFNDTFELQSPAGSPTQNYSLTATGIAWSSDRALYGPTAYKLDQIAVPPDWYKRWGPNGYTTANPPPDLQSDESFQVWMRTAGLPTFTKLALRNDAQIMSKGRYQVNIGMNFPVEEYGGTKEILLSTVTIVGGRNTFLGIAYIVIGGLCILLGFLFMVAHLVKPRKLGDHTYLTWNNNDQPSTATSTGIARRGAEAS